ncbi:MAG: aquaporin [Armatimonadetes bacterium]|nr:aquaporin [Armatimonadota bacterium]
MRTHAFKAALAELIGTYALVLFGAGAVVANEITGGQVGWVGIALAHGVVLLFTVYAISYISGAVVNPAVTLGLMVSNRLQVFTGIAYIAVQILGGYLAALTLQLLVANVTVATPGPELTHGATVLREELGANRGLLIEAIGAFFLTFVVLSTAVDSRATPGFAGLAIGLTWAGFILWAGPLTGGSANPARTFGPAVATGQISPDMLGWMEVYFLGPILGALVAALVKAFLRPGPDEGG